MPQSNIGNLRAAFRRVKIVSGGQSGADRAALDWAIQNDLPHGGWCPKGRIAEDGRIDSRYTLRETDSEGYRQRTRQNVVDSDGTLILNTGELSDGSSSRCALPNDLESHAWYYNWTARMNWKASAA